MSEKKDKIEIPEFASENKENEKPQISQEQLDNLRSRGVVYKKDIEKAEKARNLKTIAFLAIVGLLIFGIFYIPSKIGKKEETKPEPVEPDVIDYSGKMEDVPLYIDYANDIDNDAWDCLSSAAAKAGTTTDALYLQEIFLGSGTEKPDVELTTNKDEKINLKDIEGKIVLEVIADWCHYCQLESTDYLTQAMQDLSDATFVQYMHTGGEDQVRDFYTAINMNPQRGLKVVYQNDELDSWLYEVGFNSYPSFIFIDENGKVSAFFAGVMMPEVFNGVANVAYESPIKTYQMKTKDGQDLVELARKVKIANQYRDSLLDIMVPVEMLYPQN